MAQCKSCGGTGWRLARLTPDQDFEFAVQNKPIPKVECWVCHGSGVNGENVAAAKLETGETK